MKKIFTLIFIAGLSIASFAAGTGTAQNTRITNEAYISGANFANLTNGIGTNVLAQYGGSWTATSGDEGNGTAGNTFSLTTYLSNNGNAAASVTYLIHATNIATNASTGGAWSTVFNNITSGANNISKVTLAAGGDAQIQFQSTIHSSAQNGSWREYVLVAQVSNNTTSHSYTGDNSTKYGGTIGEDATYGAGFIVNLDATRSDSRRWRLTVQGPIIAITKTIDSVAISDANAPGNAPYPGATITYKIVVINTGAGDATSVSILDAIPANTTYVANSLKCDVSGDVSGASYASTTGKTDAGSDDDAAQAGGNVEFTPAGTAADGAAGGGDGTIQATGGNDEAVCYFQVTID